MHAREAELRYDTTLNTLRHSSIAASIIGVIYSCSIQVYNFTMSYNYSIYSMHSGTDPQDDVWCHSTITSKTSMYVNKGSYSVHV